MRHATVNKLEQHRQQTVALCTTVQHDDDDDDDDLAVISWHYLRV